MKSAGYPQYEDAVRKALEETGYSNRELPDNAGEGKALITFTYSAPEKYQDYDPAVMMYDTLRQLFTGDVSVKELSGPVGIVYAVNVSAQSGIMYVVYLAALLSLNLAIINMLPLPALDGGRLLFLVIRKITGKRVTDEMEGRIHFIGITLLFMLMIYVTFNDVLRFIVPKF